MKKDSKKLRGFGRAAVFFERSRWTCVRSCSLAPAFYGVREDIIEVISVGSVASASAGMVIAVTVS